MVFSRVFFFFFSFLSKCIACKKNWNPFSLHLYLNLAHWKRRKQGCDDSAGASVCKIGSHTWLGNKLPFCWEQYFTFTKKRSAQDIPGEQRLGEGKPINAVHGAGRGALCQTAASMGPGCYSLRDSPWLDSDVLYWSSLVSEALEHRSLEGCTNYLSVIPSRS